MEKPVVKLIGNDGNAFAIIAACMKAARRAKMSLEMMEQIKIEMTAGDYDHLLRTADKYFEIE